MLEDLNTVSVDQDIEETVKLGNGDDGLGLEAGDFETSFTIDLTETPEVANNMDRIKEVIIKYLAFKLVKISKTKVNFNNFIQK